MKKTLHIVASIVLVFSMFSSFLPSTVSAVDYTGDPYVTSVKIKTPSGSVIENGDTVTVGASYNLEYEWEIPDNEYKQGDILNFSIPKEFKVISGFSFAVKDGDETIAGAKVKGSDSNGYYIAMEFTTDFVENHSYVFGTFNLQTGLNANFVNEGENEIKFPPDKVITINVPDFKPDPTDPGEPTEPSEPGDEGKPNGAGAGDPNVNKKASELVTETMYDMDTGEDLGKSQLMKWSVELGRNVLLGKASSFDEIDSITIEDAPKDQEIIPYGAIANSKDFAFKKGFFDLQAWAYSAVSEKEMGIKKNAQGGYYESFKMEMMPTIEEYENTAKQKEGDNFRSLTLDYYTSPLRDIFEEREYENSAEITIHYKDGTQKSWKLNEVIEWTVGSGTITGQTAGVEFTKIDASTKAGLAGAKFDLYKIRSGQANLYKAGIVSDSSGKVKIDKLTTGDYQFKEVEAPAGYDLQNKLINFDITRADLGDNKVITLDPFENSSETTEISVLKEWDDNDDSDGKRPDIIEVQLYANGQAYDDPEILAEGDSWSHVWTDLPKYKDGKEITYTVKEVSALSNGYTSNIKQNAKSRSYNGKQIETNAFNQSLYNFPGETLFPDYPLYDDSDYDFVITNERAHETVTISGKKIWVYDDSGSLLPNSYEPGTQQSKDGSGIATLNAEQNKPTSVKVQLYANGEKVEGKTQETNADKNWEYSFADLPKYENGQEIKYSVVEISNFEDYTTTYEGTDIKNTYSPSTTAITVIKNWDHGNNPTANRPKELKVTLHANGQPTTQTATLNADNNWSYTFASLAIKDANDTPIEYTVVEDKVNKYELTSTTEVGDVIYLNNDYQEEFVSIEGVKTWKDANNQDGKRPESIQINLFADGKQIDQLKVTGDSSANTWSYKFVKLQQYNDQGKEIVYTVTEEPLDVDGYKTEQSGTNFTNSYTPEKTSVKGKKVWQDKDNQDGNRPNNITVKLFADGKDTGKTQILATDKNEVAFEFKNLDKYNNGQEIVYTVDEVAVDGYKTSIIQSDFTIYNSYTPETTKVEGEKKWVDDNNRDGYRPDSVQINLYGDDQLVGHRMATAATNWKYSFTGLPKKDDGKDIKYTVKETKVTEYSTNINGYNVTNTHEIEKINIGGQKTWTDADNQDGKRPDSIQIHLLANGTKVANTDQTITGANDWKYEYKDLPKKDNGKDIKYTVKETTIPGYTAKYNGYDIENVHTPEVIDVKGKKIWDDDSNRDGKRPDNIVVELYADGDSTGQTRTISSVKDEEVYEFKNLPKYKNGKEIKYTVVENKVDEYATTYDGYDITNKRAPELIDIEGNKKWVDGENQDKLRPDKITVRLLADGKEVRVQNVTTDKPSDENVAWEYKFKDLPKYRDGGTPIKYTVKEDPVDAYGTTIDEFFTIVNTHKPAEVDVKGKKIWDDANDQDGKRPTEIIVELFADGVTTNQTRTISAENNERAYEFTKLPKYKKGQEIKYTVIENTVIPGYDKQYDGYDITNKYEPELIDIEGDKKWVDGENQDRIRPDKITVRLFADGKEVRVQNVTTEKPSDEKIAWEYKFKDLPKYRDHGTLIKYTVKEDPVDAYETTIDEFFKIVNTHKPAEVDVKGKKIWDDASDQDGKRPDKIIVELYADGETTGQKETLSTESNEQTFEFTNLPKYKKGEEIKYTVKEVTEMDEYETTYDGYDITNKYEPELIDIEGDKKWVDGENQDRIRPDKITVRLFADGKEVREQSITTEEPSDENIAWEYEFKDLPKYRDHGTLIKYTVKEDPVDGYETTIDEFFTIVNTHKPEEVEVTGKKTWDDANNQDGKRPTKIIINLLADGEQIDEREVTAEDNWDYEFTNLPKYKKGDEIEYKIAEELIDEYSTTYEEPEDENVTNSYTPGVTARTVMKFWEDTDNQDGKRPDEIKVQLYANGEKIREPIVLNEENDWLNTWEDLDEMSEGKTIVYTAKEVDVPGSYEVSVDDETTPGTFIIVNDYTTEILDLKGKKTWDDANNQDGKRPENITVNLLADGEVIATQEVTEKDKWTYEFTDLPTYRNGEKIIYTVTEDQVDDYTTEIDGLNITNKYTPGKTSATATKTWDDDSDKNGKRPTSISVQLYADGKAVGSKETLNKSNKWTKTWKDLDEKKDGKEIVYTVKETTKIKDYEVSINDTNIGNMILTNKYVGINVCRPGGENPTTENPTTENPGNENPSSEESEDCTSEEKPLVCETTDDDNSGKGTTTNNGVEEDCTPAHSNSNGVSSSDNVDTKNKNVSTNSQQLPQTGESGTIWYVVAGVIIVLGGLLLLFKRRRK